MGLPSGAGGASLQEVSLSKRGWQTLAAPGPTSTAPTMSSQVSLRRTLVALVMMWSAGSAWGQAQNTVGDLFQLYGKSLVIVEGKEGSGSGALLAIKGGNYILTNIHVLAENPGVTFTSASGKKLTVGDPEFAQGHDIARLTTNEKLTPLPVMTRVDQTVKIGDDIVIFGNSKGEGVFAPLEGHVTAIGPRRIEIDAAIVHGDSGSPIIHVKSGKVIGIVTYATRTVLKVEEEGSKLAAVRKFGFRIDSVQGWDERTAEQFQTEWKGMQLVERRTKDLITIYESLVKGPPDESVAPRLSAPLNNLMVNFARELKQAEAKNNGTAYLNAL